MDLGPSELLIILLVVLLLFGGAKLPGLARSLGEAKREFHKATAESGSDEPPAPVAKPAETARELPVTDEPKA